MTRSRRFVMQTSRTDCGVASALTVLNLMSRPANPVDAVDWLDPDRTGTSLDRLRRYFEEEQGLAARSLSVPASRVTEISGQVILHMAQQHYVVLLQAGDGGVLVFDPSVGPVFYPAADFASLYSGYLLQIEPARVARSRAIAVPGPPGGTDAMGPETASLFIIGFATRLLECAILLCLVAVLYLVLNHSSFPSLLLAFGLIVLCGGLILVAHQVRFDGEDAWIRRRQSRLWRGFLRTLMRGRDISGFRGGNELNVSGSVRKGLSFSIPRRSQVPAALGAVFAVPALLTFLSPVVALIHLVLYAVVLMVVQLDAVQVCRRSVRPGIGRYSKLTLGHDLLNAVSAPDLVGELAKWAVIGFAGFSVLFGALPPVALMFWILAAMQIIPTDFRRVMTLAPGLAARQAVSELTASEVPLRPQRVIGPVDLTVRHERGLTLIDGIAPLTQSLQQSDLTVREQRLIMADVVRHTLKNLPAQDQVPEIGPIRIFGPGQNASRADFEHLMIARETASGQTLPVRSDIRAVLDRSAEDLVLRDLHSCEAGDFPVFWDFRERLAVKDLQDRLQDLGMARAGHLTMKRLIVVEAA
ncbi:cysteine peptidase family C39 domain-containing protein [Sedimentitalea sp. JM2-8]|uniref:Cysteine peptidase family C39 domain-containing protein n=1 Tax=Sedimentitalea xiamensis TaxID=3050037 RepID=A0ABT7FBU8_9RHOB|nr:cysteine peptidase family C39 domain-containing protein [Sedimentitalea xiamensis]MDK3072591.1 cysteine peptidase family C39 domain-containing protein [Sedimentitalea xiamensis]